MTRLNLLLFGALIACALALVTAQHKSRKLYGFTSIRSLRSCR